MTFTVTWTQLKAFLTSKQINVQYIDMDDQYAIFSSDGIFYMFCQMPKSSPASDEQTDFETNFKSNGNKKLSTAVQPFADKTLPNGKKLFTRIHGISVNVQGSPDTIDFVVPYAACKISGIEVIGGHIGDKVSFQVLDTPTGTLSGVPNYMLNQFGFDMNVAKDFYNYKSMYDADLIQNMKLRVIYDATDEAFPRPIYINFILHEVKD